MKRRTLLAGLGTVALAGCTYAHGDGEIRRTTSFPAPGDGGAGRLFGTYGDHFVSARSGRQWVSRDTGDMDFTIATSVTVFTRAGDIVWRFSRTNDTDRMAVDERVVLAGEEGIVVSPPIEPAARPVSVREAVTDIAWEVRGRGVERVAISGDTVAATEGRTVTGLRNGAPRWTYESSTPIRGIAGIDDGFLLELPEAVVVLDVRGRETWRFEGDTAAWNRAGIVTVDDGTISCRDFVEGRRWEERADDVVDVHAVTEAHVLCKTEDGLRIYDAANGDPVVAFPPPPPSNALVITDAENAYYARRGSIEAVDTDGTQWRQSIEVDGQPLDGWTREETVHVLFSEGEIIGFNREHRGRPLFL